MNFTWEDTVNVPISRKTGLPYMDTFGHGYIFPDRQQDNVMVTYRQMTAGELYEQSFATGMTGVYCGDTLTLFPEQEKSEYENPWLVSSIAGQLEGRHDVFNALTFGALNNSVLYIPPDGEAVNANGDPVVYAYTTAYEGMTPTDIHSLSGRGVVINPNTLNCYFPAGLLEQAINTDFSGIIRPTIDIIRDIMANLPKTPHTFNGPVLIQENGIPYLAFISSFYTKDHIERGRIPRPTLWIRADIVSGRISEEIETKDLEFDHRHGYDTEYNIRNDGSIRVLSTGALTELYCLMDDIRAGVLSARFDRNQYEKYLNALIMSVPTEFRGFFRELAVFGDNMIGWKKSAATG